MCILRHRGALLLQGNIDMKTAPWPQLSEAARDCVRKLLTRDPARRPTATEILQVGLSCDHWRDVSSACTAGNTRTGPPSPI